MKLIKSFILIMVLSMFVAGDTINSTTFMANVRQVDVPYIINLGVVTNDNLFNFSFGTGTTSTTTTSTTTSTSTSSTEATTTTTIPSSSTTLSNGTFSPGEYGNSGTLWMYIVALPIVASLLSIASFIVKRNVLPPTLASIFWFISGITTTNIKFVGDFRVTGDTDYSFLGNPEFGYAYLGFGVIMLLYAILIVIKYMKENSVEVTE